MANCDLTTATSLLTIDSAAAVLRSTSPEYGRASSLALQEDGLQEWVAFKSDLFKCSDTPSCNSTVPTVVVPSPSSTMISKLRGPRSKHSASTTKYNLASTNRAKFLVGFNRIDNIVAVTYLEESRRVTHDRPTSLATSLRSVHSSFGHLSKFGLHHLGLISYSNWTETSPRWFPTFLAISPKCADSLPSFRQMSTQESISSNIFLGKVLLL